ncbi:MAG: COP23 domain-containing protein [Stigonema ocellatum SAG 48.90 = DSM 106950]|nr:COP23 domain-containing protein [Stigonema ocellatum SAG 48.90 = DSM 106950]
MKLRLFVKVLTGVAIAFGTTVTLNQPSYAEGATFYCSKSNGVYTTFVRTQDGKNLPIIRWVSNYFSVTGLTQEQRCYEISRRFQSNYDQGTLKYIKAGRLNKQPVVCAAAQKNAACRDTTLLFTLKRGSDPNAIARKLFDRRALAAGNVVNQSGGDTSNDPLNIDVEAYLYFAPSQTNTDVSNNP